MNINHMFSLEEIERAMERHALSRNQSDKIASAKTIAERCALIRQWYEWIAPEIEKSAHNKYAVDRYAFGWFDRATPIEQYAWQDITMLCMVFYPQYPIAQYFADFANPKLKLVIECDGKQYHDKERDQKRDDVMIELGWKVCRISGSECAKIIHLNDILDDWDMDSPMNLKQRLDEWANHTSTGILTGVNNIYFEHDDFGYEDLERRDDFYNYAMIRATESAYKHISESSKRRGVY